MPADSPNGRKYFLIATGVSQYDAPGFDPLPAVTRDVASMVQLFTNSFGYQRALAEVGLEASADDFRLALRSWLLEEGRNPEDVVVVYFAGHGYVSNSMDHYLCFRGFTTRDPLDSGMRASDLAARFYEGEREAPESVWLILDTCYSGAGGGQATSRVSQLLEQARPNAYSGFWVLASARSNEGAREGAFTPKFFEIVTERLQDPAYAARSAEILRPDGLAEELNRRFKDGQITQRALLSGAAIGQMFPFFPNPEHRRDAAGLDLETQSIWLEKARGAEPGEPGDFFTGRSTALEHLSEWLLEPRSDFQIRIVTGDMGSGKSAVLGRLVSTQSPDLAVDARARSADEIQGAIAHAAGSAANDWVSIQNALRARGQPFRLVVDSLDEAMEPEKTAQSVLKPLAVESTVRLVVGTRRSLLSSLGEAEVVDLDHPPYWAAEDLAKYIQARLERGLMTGAAYYPAARARELAAAVAGGVAPSFLLARLAIRAILQQKEPIDTTSSRWEQRVRELLPGSAEQAYETDSLRFGAEGQTVRDVLRPLAYARGRGLPWGGIWEAVASRIAGREYTTSDVNRVQLCAGFYIVEDVEQGPAVYRLFHESLESYLKQSAEQPRIERYLTEALIQTAPHREDGAIDWASETRPYVRSYLALHAAAAGMLRELVHDPAYLAIADPDLLQEAMRDAHGQVPAEVSTVHARVIHHLRSSAPQEALSYLEMAARLYGRSEWARRISEADGERGWDVPWMLWKAEMPHRVIRVPDEVPEYNRFNTAWPLAAGEFRGGSSIFSGGLDGKLRIWNAHTAKSVAEPHVLFRRRITCLALFIADDRLLVYAAGDYGEACVVNPNNPVERTDASFSKYTVNAVAVTRMAGRPVCVCGLGDGSVCVWDPKSKEMMGDPLLVDTPSVYAVAALETDDGACIAAGGSTGKLYMWELRGSRRELRILPQQEEAIVYIGVARPPGGPVFVSVSRKGEVLVWDRNGKAIQQFRTGHDITREHGWVGAAAVGSLDGLPVIAAGDSDNVIRVLDFESGLLVGDPLRGHSGRIVGLTMGTRAGESYVASSGEDGTIRIWDHGAPGTAEPPMADPHLRSAAIAKNADGNDVVLCGGADGMISVWALADGSPAGPVFDQQHEIVNDIVTAHIDARHLVFSASGHDIRAWDFLTRKAMYSWTAGRGQIQALASAELKGQPVIASGSFDGSLGVWDARTGKPLYGAIKHPEQVFCVCIAPLTSEKLCLLSGCYDEAIRIFDLATGKALGAPLHGHKGPVVSVIVGEWRGRKVVLSGSWDGTIRVWDAVHGTALHQLRAHEGSVNSLALLPGRSQSVLISGGSDGFVHIWGPLDRPRASIDLDTFVMRAVPTGNMLAVATGKGLLALRVRS